MVSEKKIQRKKVKMTLVTMLEKREIKEDCQKVFSLGHNSQQKKCKMQERQRLYRNL